MNRLHWLLATVSVIGGNSLAVAQPPLWADPRLSPQQQKLLRQFQATLETPPANPNETARHLQRVRDEFKKFLSVNNRPDGQSTDILAGTMTNGLASGQMSAQQSVLLAKRLAEVLDQKQITYGQTTQFVGSIEPLVNQTGFRGVEKMRLYREALKVLTTAPTYSPPGR